VGFKKGLLPGQVLAFIIAGLIFVLILGFGYKSISGLLKSSSDIGLAEIRSDLDSAVESVYPAYGSVRKLSLRVPKGIEEICFFDFDDCGSPGLKSSRGRSLDWAVRACQAGSANVFSVPRLLDLSVKRINVVSGFVCIPAVGGLVDVKLTGRGDHVDIDRWVSER